MPDTSGNPIRLLLIEDEAGDACLIEALLAEANTIPICLEHVDRVQSGLDRLKQGDINTILLDLSLPDSQGLETFERVHRAAPDIPVIVMSGLDDQQVALDAVGMGAQEYLVKGSVDGKQLSRLIVHAIERKRAQLEQTNHHLQDTNERLKQALDELKATQQKVRQQDRLTSLGTMASGIAHDFNNSLSPILGYSEMMLQTPTLLDTNRKQVLEWIRTIHTAANDAASVVRRMRGFYRSRESDEPIAAIDMESLVGTTIELTRPRWNNETLAKGFTITLNTEVEPGLVITGVQTELSEAFTNLVFNAVDAMPAGGTLTIRARTQDGHAMIDFVDTGEGMPEETLAHCLEPFYTTKGSGGSGLGLAMVHGIVRRHEGTLDVQSEVGSGTTMTISLPIQLDRVGEAQSPVSNAAVQPVKILLVEDDPRVQDVLRRHLEGDGHLVHVADSGIAGLGMFLQGWFDLVITDMAMPGMSGDKLATAIKRSSPEKPVIMMTGFGDIMAEEDKPNSVDVLLSKPITSSQIREALQTALASG